MIDGPRPTMTGDAGSRDPIMELRAVAELRTDLDRREAAAVRRARVAGYSWQAIALCLGVSKQAAHKRYGRA